jgi:plasmid stability protein
VTRNLTLAIDDDLLDKVRVLAAMKRTSVNEMVRGFLQRAVEEEREADEAREALLRLIDESEGRGGEGWRPPTREETYSGDPRFDREY